MDFKIGDAEELANAAEKIIKRSSKTPDVNHKKIWDMQLGDLQNEVIAAQQRPFSRLAGINGYESTKEHKNFWKKRSKQRLNHPLHGLRKAVTYKISDEIIEFLRPSVEKGNQRALYTACLNARPRHNNMWIEWAAHNPLNERGLTGWHIYTYNSVFQFRGGHVARSYAVKPGECFHFENYYEVGSYHPVVEKNQQMTGNDKFYKQLGAPNLSRLPKRVGISRISGSTDIWASDRVYEQDGSTYQPSQIKANDQLNGIWFLGDPEGEFSPDMQTIMGKRWRIGLNNYIEDIGQNSKDIPIYHEKHKMAWVVAIMSLMNFDWFVEEPQNADIQGIKPMRGNVKPFDSHHTVLLKLPPTKGRGVMPEQPSRTESYGVRRHEVAGHKRHYRDEFGQIYKTVYVRPHERGNAKLGRVTKDYAVVKDDKGDT